MSTRLVPTPPGYRVQLTDDIAALLSHMDPYGIEPEPVVKITREMEEVNDQTVRVFAQTLMKRTGPGEIHLAPQFFMLGRKYQLGVLAHELGHVLLRGDPAHSETDADERARVAGLHIKYDRARWPGKGLQYLEEL